MPVMYAHMCEFWEIGRTKNTMNDKLNVSFSFHPCQDEGTKRGPFVKHPQCVNHPLTKDANEDLIPCECIQLFSSGRQYTGHVFVIKPELLFYFLPIEKLFC